MPVLPSSTFRILKEKASNHFVDETWIDWALEMIEAGFESDSLYELAGQLRPVSHLELQDLTTKVLESLGLKYSDRKQAVADYGYNLISSSLYQPEKYRLVLSEFRDLYYEQDMDEEFRDFAFLYWAKEDLDYSEVQWYWHGANRSNIDNIIEEQFRHWLRKYEIYKADKGLLD